MPGRSTSVLAVRAPRVRTSRGGTPRRGALRTVALLRDEPAGLVATRTAGTIEFRATLTWRNAGDALPRPTFPGLPAGCRLRETDGAGTRVVTGEIRALTERELELALDVALRAATTTAALTEAMLETSAVRRAAPGVASPGALQGIARDLWEAGFCVRFAPLWTPAPEADVWVGAGGCDGRLEDLFRSHPSWEIA